LECELHTRPPVCGQRLAEFGPGRVLLGQGGVVGPAVPLQDLVLPAQPQVGAARADYVIDGEEGHALNGERGAGAVDRNPSDWAAVRCRDQPRSTRRS
jgi:hypothetical protein